MYSDIAEMFFFLANLKATKLEIVRGVKLLEAYPDVDPKLTNKLLHFHLYVRQTQRQGLTEEQAIFPCLTETFIKLCVRKKFALPFLMWQQY